MEAVQNLPAHQQQEFMKHLENMQLKDSLSYVAPFLCVWCHVSKTELPSTNFVSYSECTTILWNVVSRGVSAPSGPRHLTSPKVLAWKIAHRVISR
jgi:hypothetical protein